MLSFILVCYLRYRLIFYLTLAGTFCDFKNADQRKYDRGPQSIDIKLKYGYINNYIINSGYLYRKTRGGVYRRRSSNSQFINLALVWRSEKGRPAGRVRCLSSMSIQRGLFSVLVTSIRGTRCIKNFRNRARCTHAYISETSVFATIIWSLRHGLKQTMRRTSYHR